MYRTMPERPGAIILARMDSSRLPGKALADVSGVPLIGHVLRRVRAARCLGEAVALATTARAVDAPLVSWARAEGVPVVAYAGPVNDVAARLMAAAGLVGYSWVFRVNADSPHVDPTLLDEAANLAGPGIDLVTNLRPRRFPYGVAVELLRTEALRQLINAPGGLTPTEQEHATAALYARLPAGRIASVPGGDAAWPSVRMTVDTPEDLARFRAFVQSEGPRWPITPVRDAVDWYCAREAA